MAASDTAKLIASLELKDAFSKPLAGAGKALSQFDAKLSQTQGRAFKAGQQIGTGIRNGAKIAAIGIGLIATQVIVGLRQLAKLETATIATNTVLTSTKGVSGQTAASVRTLAENLENLNATIDDKVIQSAENMLLTFTNVRKEAFEPALLAALNLNEALGGGEEGLQAVVIKVGKALNDPAKGLAALSKAGVLFTAQQKEQIKALQESGDLLGAQKIILAELGTEFGGRFAAEGKSATATVSGIGDAAEDLQKTLATGLFPTIQKVLPRIRAALASPELIRNVGILGDKIASLFSDSNIAAGTAALGDLFKTVKSLLPAIQAGAEVTGKVITTAVNAFKSLPPEIQALAVAGLAINKLTGGLVTNIAGGLISAVISSFKGLMNVNAAVVNVNGGVGGGDVVSKVAGGAATTALGISAAAVAALIAAPIVIAGVGLLVTKLADPDGSRALEGKAATARARGIPDSNNKPLQQLKQLTAVEDRSYDAIERLRTAVTADTLSVNVANVKDFPGPTKAENRAAITADRAARGLTGPFKRSTTLAPRLQFLRGEASGAKDVSVANAIATGFERGATPLFRDTKLIPKSIHELRRDQRQLLKAGDTKNAALIGADIRRMKAELARRTAAATKAIRDKDLKVTTNVSVPVSVKQFINGRLIDAATGRFTSTIVGSKGAFREFG